MLKITTHKCFFERVELDIARTELHETIRVPQLDNVDDEEEMMDGVERENMNAAMTVED